MKTLTLAALIAGLALTAGASALASDDAATPAANPPAKRACFFSHQINGWQESRTRGENVVYLNVNAHDVYRRIRFAATTPLGVQTHGGGIAICDGLDVTLVVQEATGPYRCPVSKITKLTPAEIKALKTRS